MTRGRILIIDDDRSHLDSTRGILEADGYDVVTHAQAFGSTNVVKESRPDLVLLDVNMPGLSGDRLAEIFQEQDWTRPPRIVLYSSNDEDMLRSTARRLKLDGYISKGSPRLLRSKVAEILASRSFPTSR